jgi:nucleoside-diphosphate-sugar epimerase
VRVVVVGASGNVGTSLLEVLSGEPAVDEVIGICRRLPAAQFAKTEWRSADVTRDDLAEHFRGADAVVHLAWLIQPGRDKAQLRRVNVEGSGRVFDAAARAGVPALVYASSVGAYSEGPKDRAVDESWPTGGISTSFYSRHKAEVERLLDAHEESHPGMRVVRLRPGLIFKREAGAEIRRLFAGPFLPNGLVKPGLIPLVPAVPNLRFQAVHSLDVADAYRLALVGAGHGAYNVAADPVLDPKRLAGLLNARTVPLSPRLLRAGAALSYRLRLQPTEPGWVDMGLGVPVMDTRRIREELGWSPRRNAGETFLELLEGLRHGAGLQTPPLEPGGKGPLRTGELKGGVGSRLGG